MFLNKVRLPFYLSKPQFALTQDVYKRSDGTRRVLASEVEKEMQAVTDYLPENWHERIAIALQHPVTRVTSPKYIQEIRVKGGYEIEWPELMDWPIAPAKFKALEEGFLAVLSSCSGCDDMVTINAEDDLYPGDAEEGDTLLWLVGANDSLCCEDPVFSIVSFDATFVDSAVIDPATGLLTVVLKALTPTGTINLVRYRVTCGGVSDEADFISSVTGTLVPGFCEPPTNLVINLVDGAPMPHTVQISWTPPATLPALFVWEIRENGLLFSNGTTVPGVTNFEITGVPAGAYQVYVWSQCDPGDPTAISTKLQKLRCHCRSVRMWFNHV